MNYRKKPDSLPLRVRNIGIQRVKVADLEDSPWNLNDHPQAQQDALDGAVDELGFYGYPDVYQTKRGTLGLIDGHLRKSRLLARYGAETEIEVNVTDFDEQGAKAANLTKDPLGRMAEENAANLDLLLRDFQTGNEPLAKMIDQLTKDAGLYKIDWSNGWKVKDTNASLLCREPMKLNVTVESGIDLSIRARQVCGMFDCPPEKKQRIQWEASLPIEDKPWSIGLIVGPSGCGKSTCARHLWPTEYSYQPSWEGSTVIDCFDKALSIETVSQALNSVGFSTIPAWLRSYGVLSNGERFRAEIARRLIEQPGLIVVDEFTSVVDRQVATVACHSVQKFVRKQNRQLVAVTCHSDVIDWLQPDWIFEPAERLFRWRSLQRRPEIRVEVARIPYEAWQLFKPFHYMTAELIKAARCFGLWANGELAAFAGIIHKPHSVTRNMKGISRIVTLPDWQGLGLAFVLAETVAAAYKALGFRFRNYPAHPPFIRGHRRERWACVKQPGVFSSRRGRTSSLSGNSKQRPCAVMEFVGEAMDAKEAERLVA